MRQRTIFKIHAKVSSPPGTTPLEGSGRAVHERERPGVGWNPLSLTEGEGAGGVEGKRVCYRKLTPPSGGKRNYSYANPSHVGGKRRNSH